MSSNLRIAQTVASDLDLNGKVLLMLVMSGEDERRSLRVDADDRSGTYDIR